MNVSHLRTNAHQVSHLVLSCAPLGNKMETRSRFRNERRSAIEAKVSSSFREGIHGAQGYANYLAKKHHVPVQSARAPRAYGPKRTKLIEARQDQLAHSRRMNPRCSKRRSPQWRIFKGGRGIGLERACEQRNGLEGGRRHKILSTCHCQFHPRGSEFHILLYF